jgi:hypothetical protein
MGELHEHGRTTFAYEYPMRIWGSQRSQYQLFRRLLLQLVLLFVCSPILALSRQLVPLHQVLGQHINLVSSPIDVSFPSFGIYSIDVTSPRQSSATLAID